LSVVILGTLAQIKRIANVPQNYLRYINMGVIFSSIEVILKVLTPSHHVVVVNLALYCGQ
jgi:hypothetical protein